MFAKLFVLLFVVAVAFSMPAPDDDDDDYYFVRSFNPVRESFVRLRGAATREQGGEVQKQKQFRSYAAPMVRTYSAPIFSGIRRTFGYYDFDD